MRIRLVIGLVIALGAVFSAAALGARIEVGSGIARLPYSGSSSAGPVQFTGIFASDRSKLTADSLTAFQFANRCSHSGTSVPDGVTVDVHDGFHYSAHGITITGTLNKSENWKADGTVRVVAHGCDSGTLHFTAVMAKPTP